MTPEQRALKDAIRRNQRLLEAAGMRATAKARASSVNVQQMTVRSGRCLRVTEADVDAGLASVGDVGKLWFVPGYSAVGGPDVVPTG